MIEVNRKQFSRAVDLAAAVVGRRGAIPVLTGLKVTANGSLRLEGCDLDNWTCAELPYEGKGGEFILPEPRMLRSAINQAGGEMVSVGEGEGNCAVHLRSGQLDSNLMSLPVEDFPFTDRIGFEEFSATLGEEQLRQIARVMAAISTEETRYYLNGVCVSHVSDWTYRFAATNGHFLMIVDVPLPDAAGTIPDKTIIPRQWLNVVMSRLSRAKEGVRFSYGRMAVPNTNGPDLPLQPGGPRICVRGDLDGIVYSVTGKLIDGHYPDYERVIPSAPQYSVHFRRSALVQAVQALSALTYSKTRAVKLTFPRGKVCAELYSPDLGHGKFDLEAEHDLPDPESHIGFNGAYLLGMLSAISGEEVLLQLTNSSDPAIITDPADTAFKGVMMPMRV